MAKQRIDYVNRAGGLYGADAEEAMRKRAQKQAQQQKNTVSADQAQSKTQSASAVRNTGRNLNTAQRDSAQAVEVFRNALETARKNYVKDPSESNAQSVSRSFSMLREAENNSRNVRENWDIWKENSEKKAQETRRRASEAYDKYFSSLNQKKEEQQQPEKTGDELTLQQDMAQINAMSAQDRNDLQIYSAWKENNLAGLNIQNSVDVVWVPGQGIQSVSPAMQAADALSRLRANGYTEQRINELSQSYARYANAQTSQQLQQGASELAQDHPVLANTARVATNLAGGVAGSVDYGIEVLQGLLGKSKYYQSMDPNLQGNALSQISDSIYSTTRQNIENGWSGKVGGVLYGAATSLADNIARFYAGGGAKAVTLGLAGASAFQDAVSEKSAAGATVAQAGLKGIVDAASEVLTELIPLDNIIKLKTTDIGSVSNLLKTVLKNAGTEIATEEINYAVGLLSDWLIMGDKSDANRQKRALISDGYSEKEANKKVIADILAQAGMLALETGLSSGAQSGIEGGFNLYRSRKSNSVNTDTQDSAPDAQEAAAQTQSQNPQDETPEQKASQRLESLIEDAKRMQNGTFGNPAVDAQENRVYDGKNKQGGYNNAEGLQETDGAGLPGRTGTGRVPGAYDGTLQVSGQAPGTVGQRAEMVQGGIQDQPGASDSGNDIRVPEIIRVSDSLREAQSKKGIQTYVVKDTSATPANYEQALNAGRNSDAQNGWCVTPKSAQELKGGNVRTFMNESGTVGLGIAPDGDIVAVFKNKNGGPKNALDTMMPIAIEQGGDRLDCYGHGLVHVYENYGFVPVARVEFNSEYANDGWTPDKGNPYIYVMMHNGDDAATVTQKMKTYHKSTDAELDALPTFGKDEYDSAMAYRDSLIAQRSEGQNPSVGAADAGFTGYAQQYYDLLSDDTAQRDRPGDVRPMEVPTKDTLGREVSEFVGNAFGAAVTSDRFVSTIQELVVEGALGHDIKSHKQTLQEAADYIKANSPASVRRKVTEAAMSGKATDQDIAAAMILWADYNQSKSENRQSEAAELFVDLQQMATKAGRDLNLFNLIRKMTPQGQTKTVKIRVRRYVDSLNKGRSQKKQVEVNVPQELLDAHTKAVEAAAKEGVNPEESAAVKQAEQDIYKYAASQIGSTLKEKWDAWRHMSMLGNLKTQTRNFGGNIFFKPFVTVKRAVGAAMERAMGVSREERTKAVLGLGKDANLFRRLAIEDAKTQQATDLLSYSAKTGDNARSQIDEYRAIFDYQAEKDTSKTPQAIKKTREIANKGLEFARKGIQNLMEKTDMLFKRWEYSTSLATFLKARGYTAQQWQEGNVPAPVLEQARAYAAKEALKATFNDQNAVSDALAKLHYKGDNLPLKVLDTAFEGILPYRRTPANVAVRIEEYSPANIARAVWNGVTKVQSGQMSAATWVDQMASGLTGTGAMALGYALASGIFGIRIVGGQADEDDERRGYQKYSIVIGDKSYTIDWAAPSVVPLLVGANLYTLFSEEDDGNVSGFAKLCTALSTTFEPMLELSCLSSFADAVDSVRYAKEGEGIYSAIASIATSYFMQGLPTIGAQLDQLGDDTRQMVYADSEDLVTRQLQKTLGKISQRLPGDFYQTEYVDEWGRTQKTNAFESVLSPSYSKEIQDTPVELEISRLNDVQDENVSPKKPDYSFTQDGKTIRLSGEQWSELAKTQGQTAYRIVEELIATEQYKLLSDVEKAKAIKDAYAYAREYARVTCLDGYEVYSASWMEGIEGNEAQAIAQKALINSSGIGSEARYNRAAEMGYTAEQMREVAAQVNQRLAGLENKTDYDTYRAVVDSVQEKELNNWLQVYGMSESRLEDMAKARKRGIYPSSYVDYIEAKSSVESAVSALTSAWKDSTAEPLEELSAAYKAFSGLPSTVISYYKENNGGKAKAFIDAMDAGVSVKTFSNLFKRYMELENSEDKPAVQADQWAAVLDRARNSGQINQKQRDILFADLGIFVTMRMDAAKYTELTDLGVDPDTALYVRNVMSDLSKKREKLDAISGADLDPEEKEAAARAYLDEKEEEQLDEMLDLGFDVDTYAVLYGLYSDESGTGKKARVKAAFMRECGLTDSEAEAVYRIFYGR